MVGFPLKWVVAAMLVFCAAGTLAQVEINEVMYDPLDGNEWVEIYNNGNEAVNLSGWNLSDDSGSDTIGCCNFASACSLILAGNSHALLTDQDTALYQNITTSALQLCVDDNSIGNGLKNSGETITIYNGSSGTSLQYDGSIGQDGKTIEKNKNAEWKESLILGGTPGAKNSVYDFSYDYSKLKINEIMVDPVGGDDEPKPQGEWVEIYNSGKDPIYLGGLVLYDQEDDHELYVTNSNTGNLELCSGCYTVVYRDSDSDFDLSKTEDTIRLYTGYPLSDSTLIDQISFSNAVERTSFAHFDAGWFKAKPTPEAENIYSEGCDWKIEVEIENAIVASNLSFTVKVNRLLGIAEEITARGKIEDLFGKEISDYKPWTNDKVTTTASKDYSPNLKEGVYQISFWLENLTCRDIDTNNNIIKELIAINPQYQKKASSLNIEKIYLGNDNSVQWGDQFTAKINIYKGDETKNSILAWVEKDKEKISKTTKINIYDNYKTYPLTVPLQLLPNCNQKIKDGKAALVVEGMDLREEEDLSVSGVDEEMCKDYLKYISKEKKEENSLQTYQIINLPPSLNPGEVLRLKVQILNDDTEHNYKLWSYVYRGNKCYSCLESSLEREENAQSVTLKPDEAKIVDFLLKLDEGVDEGEYKVKVKINKDDQKTDKELTEKIYVVQNGSISQAATPLETFAEGIANESTAIFAGKRKIMPESGVLIYESNIEKAKGWIPYTLIIALGLLSVGLVMRKK